MPGLLRGVARTAVVAGTATAVSNRVSRRQANRWSQQDQSQYAEPQYAQPQYAQPQYAAPAPPPPPAASSGTNDMLDQLSRLAELKANGILTEQEFAQQKARILAGRALGHAVSQSGHATVLGLQRTDHPIVTTHTDDALVSQTITRSPADLLRLVVAVAVVLLLLLFEWLFGDALVGFVSDLLTGLSAIPQWIIDVAVTAARIISIVVLVAGLLWTIVRSGMRMLITVALGIGLAIVMVIVLGDIADIADGANSVEVSSGLGPLTAATFPSVYGIAALAGALTAAAPWLSRRWRRWGWIAVLGLVFTRFVTTPASFDSFESVLFGWLAGAAALVILGAPTRRATAQGLMRSLAAVGLPLATLEAAGVDARGSTPYFGAGPDGSRYFVKALGQDQRSADLLFRMYRGIQRKDLGDERPFSSLRRAVEHEAFVALAARDLGTRTPRIRGFATAEPNTFVLAYEAVAGRSLDRLQPDEITDDVLHEIWLQIAHLRAHRIAHRDLRLANLFRADDGVVWMIDFGFSEIAASDLLLATDVAELVASSSVVVGVERATAHARDTVDAETLARACDRLQPWALSGATRTALKERPGLLAELRARLASR